MTNADNIAKSGGSGVIEFLIKTYNGCPYMNSEKKFCTKQMSCRECWCEWLSQDVTDNRAVEVVRCKDCLMWDGNNCASRYGLLGPRPDDYCSIGKRRVDNR